MVRYKNFKMKNILFLKITKIIRINYCSTSLFPKILTWLKPVWMCIYFIANFIEINQTMHFM